MMPIGFSWHNAPRSPCLVLLTLQVTARCSDRRVCSLPRRSHCSWFGYAFTGLTEGRPKSQRPSRLLRARVPSCSFPLPQSPKVPVPLGQWQWLLSLLPQTLVVTGPCPEFYPRPRFRTFPQLLDSFSVYMVEQGPALPHASASNTNRTLSLAHHLAT
jgi:hypothetical protein